MKGSCLCGTIRYEVDAPLGELGHCHCTMCRKAHGAAFGTYVSTPWSAFRLVSGEEALTRFESSPGITRTFCARCGSTLQFIRDGRPGFGLAAGTLDDDPGVRATYQIWTRDKAPWWHLEEGLPTWETEP